MLALLLDENISFVVAEQVSMRRPDVPISSVHRWEAGRLLACDDEVILREAGRVSWTLVTYDVNTIPLLLRRLADDGATHGGVIFVDRKSISSRDVGGLVRALIAFWDAEHDASWTDRVTYLPTR